MDALSLATDGIICSMASINYMLPFNLQLKTDVIKLSLKHLEVIKLNTILNQKKLNLIKLPSLKLNKKVSNILKLNLKKED